MRGLLAILLLISSTAFGQTKVAPCKMDGSDCGTGGAGSGTVTTTGSPSSGQVALVSGATSITGDAGLTYDTATNAFSGTGPWTLTPASDIPSLTVRRFGAAQTNYVLQVQTEINGFLSGIDATGTYVGPVTALKSATTSVDVSAATAPSTGQVLKATDSTHATWQADSGGITNSAGANVIAKSDGTNVVATSLTEASAGAIATTAGTALGLTATAPAATTGASQAGKAVSITASPAVASTDTNGAAAGGSVTITAGAAARNTSGNANGGDISLVTGAGIGTGTAGQVLIPDGIATKPSLSFSSLSTNGFFIRSGQLRIAAAGVETGYIGNDIMSVNAFNLNNNAYWTSPGAAVMQLGAVNAAAPVAQTLGVQNARGGTDTNTAGQPWTLRGSLGTGTAVAGALALKTGYPTSTGTTQHVASTRAYLPGQWTALTAETPTAIATLTFGASSVIGGQWLVTIKAADATDFQAVTYRVTVNSIRNAAGNTVSTVAATADAVAAGTGTLTATFSVTEGASAAVLNCTATSSLTETTLAASWQSLTNGSGLTLAQN